VPKVPKVLKVMWPFTKEILYWTDNI